MMDHFEHGAFQLRTDSHIKTTRVGRSGKENLSDMVSGPAHLMSVPVEPNSIDARPFLPSHRTFLYR